MSFHLNFLNDAIPHPPLVYCLEAHIRSLWFLMGTKLRLSPRSTSRRSSTHGRKSVCSYMKRRVSATLSSRSFSTPSKVGLVAATSLGETTLGILCRHQRVTDPRYLALHNLLDDAPRRRHISPLLTIRLIHPPPLSDDLPPERCPTQQASRARRHDAKREKTEEKGEEETTAFLAFDRLASVLECGGGAGCARLGIGRWVCVSGSILRRRVHHVHVSSVSYQLRTLWKRSRSDS